MQVKQGKSIGMISNIGSRELREAAKVANRMDAHQVEDEAGNIVGYCAYFPETDRTGIDLGKIIWYASTLDKAIEQHNLTLAEVARATPPTDQP